MLQALINFLLNRKGHPVQRDTTLDPQAPYKVEAPEPVKCGCGRSPTGYCVGLHKLSEEEWAKHPDNKKSEGGTWPFPNPVGTEEKPAEKPKKPRAKKAPVAAMTAAPKKPRAKKAPKAQ